MSPHPVAFPVVHSVLAPSALLDYVSEQYDLGVARRYVLLRSWRGIRDPQFAGPLDPQGHSPRVAVYDRVGRTLAAMHRALDSFVTTMPRRALTFAYLAQEPLARLQPWLEDRPSDWEFLHTLANQVHTRLDRLTKAMSLAWGPIHGDATLDNLLVLPDGQVGIIDFDQSGPGWRAYELQGVFAWAWESAHPEYWTAALDGYTAVGALSPADVAAMPCFVVLNRLWCMGMEVHVISRNHGQAIVDHAYLDRHLATLRRWAAAYFDDHANPAG